LQAHPSGQLSDSDVYAITHAESAAESSTPAKETSSAYSNGGKGQLPALMQLQALADADAITPQSKLTKAGAGAAADSPAVAQPFRATASSPQILTRAAASGPQQLQQQLPGLSQLRALAGVADSPQPPSQLKKTAKELTDLASVPLSQWQFGNNATAHAVWQADTTPAKQASPNSAAADIKPRRSHDKLPPAHDSALPRVASAAPPTSWGPSEPPNPVTLKLKVMGDGDSPDEVPAISRDASLRSSAEDQNTAAGHGFGTGGFGFEAGYGSRMHGIHASDQPPAAGTSAMAGTEANVTGSEAGSGTGGFEGAGIFADGSGAMQTADSAVSSRQHSVTDGAHFTAVPGGHPHAAGGFAQQGTAALAGAASSQQSQALNPGRSPGLQGLGSAGADELAEAASRMTGSPWDPKQGPKLLESLSDFSSFNSSLSMLQQLAGKSAAGLANLGIGKPAASSSPKSLEKKKSDKGHLVSSAPTSWWQRHRPGSAKKRPAPQGSERRPSAPAQAAGNRPPSPSAQLGISRFSAPVDQRPDVASANMQPARLAAAGNAVSGSLHAQQPTHTAQTAAAAGSSAAATTTAGLHANTTNGRLATGAPGNPQPSQVTTGDASNCIYYNLGTADRPLSSFRQAPAAGMSSPLRPKGVSQGRQIASGTAGCEAHADECAYSDQPILSSSGPRTGQSMADSQAGNSSGLSPILASAAALSGSDLHQEGQVAGADHEAAAYQEGRSAEASPEPSPVPSPGSKPSLGPAGPLNGIDSSPTTSHLLATVQGMASHQPQQQSPGGPVFGYSVQQEVDMPAGSIAASHGQLPGAAHDAGHVAAGPLARISEGVALDQLYSLAQGTGGPHHPQSGAAGDDSPSVSGFGFGQSLDLSKVSHHFSVHMIWVFWCTAGRR